MNKYRLSEFRRWLNEDLHSQRDVEMQKIWADTFKALGVGGLSDEDAAQQSLSKITFNHRSPDHGPASQFKGKQAARKRLENGQIFSRLEQTNDPELRKAAEETRHWLDSKDGDQTANASTTVSMLLQKLFGEKYFQRFIDKDLPRPDQAKAQVEPQPPKDSMEPDVQAPANSMDPNTPQPNPPMSPMMQQQPQVPQQGSAAPAPNSPMPPKPAGSELGLF